MYRVFMLFPSFFGYLRGFANVCDLWVVHTSRFVDDIRFVHYWVFNSEQSLNLFGFPYYVEATFILCELSNFFQKMF